MSRTVSILPNVDIDLEELETSELVAELVARKAGMDVPVEELVAALTTAGLPEELARPLREWAKGRYSLADLLA